MIALKCTNVIDNDICTVSKTEACERKMEEISHHQFAVCWGGVIAQ